MRRSKHEWRCVGGGGGWEVWECVRCGLTAIPNIFGGLWPDLLGRLSKRWRCIEEPGKSAQSG